MEVEMEGMVRVLGMVVVLAQGWETTALVP
jgi:hypothetical protein